MKGTGCLAAAASQQRSRGGRAREGPREAPLPLPAPSSLVRVPGGGAGHARVVRRARIEQHSGRSARQRADSHPEVWTEISGPQGFQSGRRGARPVLAQAFDFASAHGCCCALCGRSGGLLARGWGLRAAPAAAGGRVRGRAAARASAWAGRVPAVAWRTCVAWAPVWAVAWYAQAGNGAAGVRREVETRSKPCSVWRAHPRPPIEPRDALDLPCTRMMLSLVWLLPASP